MSDTDLRRYALHQAREILGAAPLTDVLNAAAEIYDFLTDRQDCPGCPGCSGHADEARH